MSHRIYRVGNYTILDENDSKNLYEVPTKLISIENTKAGFFEIKEGSNVLFKGHVSGLQNINNVEYNVSTFNTFRNV
jgi:hypothetical protein